MAAIVLITGGSRSGKSTYAQALCERGPGSCVYVATGVEVDDEMRERIARHRASRDADRWDTVEERLDLPGALRRVAHYDTVLVDCVTVWIANLLVESEGGTFISEDDVAELCGDLLQACGRHPGQIVFVTNEVGLSVVPDNPLGRRFRDLAGRCNQILAAAADEVILMVCGVPMQIKPASVMK